MFLFTRSIAINTIASASLNGIYDRSISPNSLERHFDRAYLNELKANGLSSHSIHGHFRAIRTMMRYASREFGIPLLDFEGLAPVHAKPILGIVRQEPSECPFNIPRRCGTNFLSQYFVMSVGYVVNKPFH